MNDDILLSLGDEARRAQDAALALRPLPPLVVERAGRARMWPGVVVAGAAGFALCAVLVVTLVPVDRSGDQAARTATAPALPAWVTPSSGARVSTTSDGALSLEEGALSLAMPDVAGASPTSVVHAGPYVVELAPGARALVRWDAAQLALAVNVEAGDARARGPGIEGVRVVDAGHPLDVKPRVAEATTSSPPPVPPPDKRRKAPEAAAPVVDTAVVDAGPEVVVDEDEPAPAIAPTWQDLARQNRHTQAVAAARVVGIAGLLETASAADLLLLGTSARFAADTETSTRAFSATRERFPDTVEAARAAFFLARIASDVKQDDDDAVRLLRAYLEALPADVYRQEATGRLVEALVHSGHRADAVAPARTYLALYPGGPHAELCRSIVGEAR